MTDVDDMKRRLAALLPNGERLTAVRPLATGFSNKTYRLDGLDLILRLPPSAGAMLDGHDVLDQARIYRALGKMPGAPPVPAITWIGDDPATLFVPFFVMAQVSGEALHDLDMQAWFTDVPPERRTQMCRAWIGAFARLATLPLLPALGQLVGAEDTRAVGAPSPTPPTRASWLPSTIACSRDRHPPAGRPRSSTATRTCRT